MTVANHAITRFFRDIFPLIYFGELTCTRDIPFGTIAQMSTHACVCLHEVQDAVTA